MTQPVPTQTLLHLCLPLKHSGQQCIELINQLSTYHHSLARKDFLLLLQFHSQLTCCCLPSALVGSHRKEIGGFGEEPPDFGHPIDPRRDRFMQQGFREAVGEGVAVLAYEMVRIAWEFLLDTVEHVIDLSIGVRSLAQENRLSEVWVVRLGRHFHNSGFVALVTSEGEFLEVELDASVIKAQSAGVERCVGWVEVIDIEIDVDLNRSVQFVHKVRIIEYNAWMDKKRVAQSQFLESILRIN